MPIIILCTRSLHFQKSFTITEITRRIFQFSFLMHIQYLHTYVGSHIIPIEKSMSSVSMEGMPHRVSTLPPYRVSGCVPDTQNGLSITQQINIKFFLSFILITPIINNPVWFFFIHFYT